VKETLHLVARSDQISNPPTTQTRSIFVNN